MEFHGHWRIIVNPAAGGGRAGRMWPAAADALVSIGLDHTPAYTSNPSMTRELALAAAAEGCGGLAVYGGDGTLSTVASAIAGLPAPPVLAQLPAGSGNDWIRSIGIPHRVRDAAVVIKRGVTGFVDSGLCRVGGKESLFINSAGMGFDAFVLRRTLSLRKVLPLGKSGYLLSLAFSALAPPRWRASISAGATKIHSGGYFTLTIGVGRFSGGGMSLSPTAVPDDGLLDAVWILPVGFPTILRNLPRVFDGTLMEMPQTRSHRSTSFSVDPDGALLLELDGEFQDLPEKPGGLVFENGPRFKVIIPGT